MTKKKKLINALVFLVGLIVFVIYYFKDNTDTDIIEIEQDSSAEAAADSIFNVFDDEIFDDVEIESDSTASDSL